MPKNEKTEFGRKTCKFPGAKIPSITSAKFKDICKKGKCNLNEVCVNNTYWEDKDNQNSVLSQDAVVIQNELGCILGETSIDCTPSPTIFVTGKNGNWRDDLNGTWGFFRQCGCQTELCNGVGLIVEPSPGNSDGNSDGTPDETSDGTPDGKNTTPDGGVSDGSSLTMGEKKHLIIAFLVGAIWLH